MTPEQTSLERWWGPLRRVRTVPLGDADRVRLSLERRRDLWRAWRALAAIPLFPAALVAVVILLVPDAVVADDLKAIVLAGAIILHMLLGIPILILRARDAFRRSRLLKKDLHDGRLEIFAGRIDLDFPLDGALEGLVSAGILLPGSAEVEVLTGSRRVLRANGGEPRSWVEALVGDVAPVVGAAFDAPIPEEWNPPPDGPPARQRHMSSEEKDEVRRHARRLRWFRLLPTIGVCIWFGLGLAQLAGGNLRGGQRVTLLVSGFLCVVLVRSSIERYRLSSRLATDLAVARIVRVGNPNPPAESAAEKQRTEFLPVSGLLWTDDGRPAPWRSAKW